MIMYEEGTNEVPSKLTRCSLVVEVSRGKTERLQGRQAETRNDLGVAGARLGGGESNNAAYKTKSDTNDSGEGFHGVK